MNAQLLNRNRITPGSASDDRRGAVTVEFAVCAAIFFMFIFSMLELTRYIYVQHTVQMVAYEAARAGVVPGRSFQDVVDRANILLDATGVNTADVTVTPTTINSLTEQVSVNVSCNFADNSWFPPTLMAGRQISTTITLQHENMAYLQPGDTDLASIIGNNDNEPIDE